MSGIVIAVIVALYTLLIQENTLITLHVLMHVWSQKYAKDMIRELQVVQYMMSRKQSREAKGERRFHQLYYKVRKSIAHLLQGNCCSRKHADTSCRRNILLWGELLEKGN